MEHSARLHAHKTEPVTGTQAAQQLAFTRTAASRRVRSAKDRCYLRDLEDNPRKPSRCVLAGPLPEDLEILAQLEVLKDA